MILILAGVAVVLIVFVIAAIAIGRETHRLDAMPPAPSFELVYAVDWISDRLSPEISAQISYEDVRDIIDWHLQELSAHGVKQTALPEQTELVVMNDNEAVDSVMFRALAEGRELRPEHVKAVLDGELAYLEAIGAVGPIADAPPE